MDTKDKTIQPKIIRGNHFTDERGRLTFNNDFNAFGIKRVYGIEHENIDFVRAWQGHQIEQRWISAVTGSFIIRLVEIDDWVNPSKELPILEFLLTSENFDILHIPAGFANSIQALEEKSKLLLFVDCELGEVQDEFRFPSDYFNEY